jgi:hypothetical protein
MSMISTPAELTPAVLNKAVGRYYKELQDYATQADHELALRPAFQNLLAEMARKINLTLVHEMTIRGRIRPDGVCCATPFISSVGTGKQKSQRATWLWGRQDPLCKQKSFSPGFPGLNSLTMSECADIQFLSSRLHASTPSGTYNRSSARASRIFAPGALKSPDTSFTMESEIIVV